MSAQTLAIGLTLIAVVFYASIMLSLVAQWRRSEDFNRHIDQALAHLKEPDGQEDS